MSVLREQHSWIPPGIAIIGVLVSLSLWFIAWVDLDIKQHLHPFVRVLIPWLGLLAGITLSSLLAILVQMVQVARQHSTIVDRINADLKKQIQERALMEESKLKLEAAMQQGQKLQAMGTLAGGIAHDFNNLLYAISGYANMARDDVPKDSQVYQNLGKVLEATDRGRELISRILSFSRRQHHEFSELPVKGMIEAVLSLLKPTVPASVSIQFTTESEEIIFGNQTDLHQVLVNLINNAVDAMDGEGNISIHLSRVFKNDPELKLIPEAKAEQNYCKIEVSDTGAGMDALMMERIFEPFYTTKEVGKGTGLGLSIVHSIIKEHLGAITVKSEIGKGTTFTILLPELSAK